MDYKNSVRDNFQRFDKTNSAIAMESADVIHSKLEELVRMKQFAQAHDLLDRVYDENGVKKLKTPRISHPLITNETVERVCQQLQEHKIKIDLETLQKLAPVCQKTKQQSLLVSLEEQQQQNNIIWTKPMYMALIHAVWPGQAKRYFEAHILPTKNKNLIRQAVGYILWKYRVVVSKCRWPQERGELYETVRIARNFYENHADPLKGNATFLMMDIFRLARMTKSVVRLANTQPHPWSPAIYGLLMEAHSHDKNQVMYYFREMLRESPNPGGFTVMLNILAAKYIEYPETGVDDLRKIHALLLNMKDTVTPDARTIDGLLLCYGKLRDTSKVLDILRQYHIPDVSKQQKILDLGNFLTALQSFRRSNEAMYETIDMMLEPSMVLSVDDKNWVRILDTIAYLKREEAAKRAQTLVKKHVPKSVEAWTTVIKAWGLADLDSSSQRIWKIYETMRSQEKEMKLDAAFYTAVLFYLCRTHDDEAFRKARNVLQRMEKGGPFIPTPNADHYDPILEALLARSKLKAAKDQINHRMELFFNGTNPAARPQHSSFRQFVGAWIRDGKKDLRILTETVAQWTRTYQNHNARTLGPDLVVYEMLFVGWSRAKKQPERLPNMLKIEMEIRNIARLGQDEA